VEAKAQQPVCCMWLKGHVADHVMCSTDRTNTTKYDVFLLILTSYQLLSCLDFSDKNVHILVISMTGNETHEI
jgi:hypothetical protein